MIMEQFALTELDRRIANMIQIGTIHAVDHTQAKSRVVMGEIRTDWLPWLSAKAGHDRSWWSPEIGEQVVVLAPSGELNQAVILPALYQQKHPPPENDPNVCKVVFEDGTFMRYDRKQHVWEVKVHEGGSIRLSVGGASIGISKEGVRIEGDRVELN